MLEGIASVWWASKCDALCFSSLGHESTLTRTCLCISSPSIFILVVSLSPSNFCNGLTPIQVTGQKARQHNSWSNKVISIRILFRKYILPKTEYVWNICFLIFEKLEVCHTHITFASLWKVALIYTNLVSVPYCKTNVKISKLAYKYFAGVHLLM
jgi:hypothetical protein